MTRNKSVLVPVLTVMLCCGWERSHAQEPAKVPALILLRDPLAHDGTVCLWRGARTARRWPREHSRR